jgi:hypothetical protein
LLAGDVDLECRNGEPAHGGEGLHGAQETAVRAIHPSLSVLGMGERHPFRYDVARILSFMHPESELACCGGVGEHPLNWARRRAGELGGKFSDVVG